MDPKASSQLDPKLQEAYNRVMGTNLNAPTDPSTNSSTPATTDPIITPAMPAAPQDTTTMPNPAPAAPVMSSTITPSPTTAPAAPVTDQTTPTDPAPTLPTEDKPAEPETPPLTGEPTMSSMESTVSTKSHAFVAKGNSMKVSPVIIVIGGIAFLLIYSLVWIKVFNLSIPFINQ